MYKKVFNKISILFLFVPLIVLNSCCVENFSNTKRLFNINILTAETNDDEIIEKHAPLVCEESIIKSGELRNISKLNWKKADSSNFEEGIKGIEDSIVIAKENEKIERIKQDTNRAFEVANSLVGYGGSCLYIASLFIERFFGEGHSIANIYQVFDPEPGDVMYYANGGLGIEHWAIYLDDHTSLQGNFNGVAIIYPSLYLNFASEPIYYRVY